MNTENIVRLLRQVKAGAGITQEEEDSLSREGLIEIIEPFPVTLELTPLGKVTIAEADIEDAHKVIDAELPRAWEGSDRTLPERAQALIRGIAAVAKDFDEACGERDKARLEIVRIQSALDAAEHRLRRYEEGSCAGMLDRT